MKIVFPSGQTVFITPVMRERAEAEQPSVSKPSIKERYERRRHACKHVGAAIKVETGCGNSVRGGVWECALHERCAPLGLVTIEGVVCTDCPDYEKAAEPGLARLGLNLLTALGKWIAAGRPVRLQQQINSLLTICNDCPFRWQQNGATYCGKCGCPVNNSPDEIGRAHV